MSEQKENKIISRREFVRFGIAAGLFLLPTSTLIGCSAPAPTTSTTENHNPTPTPSPNPTPSTPTTTWEKSPTLTRTTTDQAGYSATLTLESWVGQRGTGQPMTHPVDPSILIPSAEQTAAVIPFYVTLKNTTKDSSFKNDMYFYASTGNYNGNSSMYLSVDGTWVDQLPTDAMPKGRITYDSITNDLMSFPGFYIIENFFSPSYPNGDFQKLIDFYYYENPSFWFHFETPDFTYSDQYGISEHPNTLSPHLISNGNGGIVFCNYDTYNAWVKENSK